MSMPIPILLMWLLMRPSAALLTSTTPIKRFSAATSSRFLITSSSSRTNIYRSHAVFMTSTSSEPSTSIVSSVDSSNSLKDFLLKKTKNSQFLFVGGKGGVGKTSTSSAIAIALSNKGYRTLIVSTDPAHSLGDALDENLSSGRVSPIVTEPSLWALEIDVDAALEEFKANAGDLNVDAIANKIGVPRDLIDSLGLEDLASIFTNPPPGIDEIVALIKIFDYAKMKQPNGQPLYDRIVIDTAPTGHTVRLLQLPNFLNSVTGKLLTFRAKISVAVNRFKGLFGGGEGQQSDGGGFLSQLEDLQETLLQMKRTLKDEDTTRFVIVTIPTSLAVAESTRLVESLQSEDIGIAAIVCNQVVAESASGPYLNTRRRGQQQCLSELKGLCTSASLELTEVPYFDTEVTGVYGLRFFASVAHPPIAKSMSNPIDSRKLTVFGGKGGVGKTTSAASWAVQLADAGMRVLVVSTDPAHSLGDSLAEPLNGLPKLIDQQLSSGGQLWAMEIDPSSALAEFKEIVQGAVGNSGGGDMAALTGLNIGSDMYDILSGVNDPPPGTDEVVALTKIVSYLEEGFQINGKTVKFDRVVLDTAPTGHTLRMLSLPVFLKSLIQKLRKISGKVGGISSMMGMGGGRSDMDKIVDGEATDRLEKFEKRMDRLETLLHNPKETEFTVVTIATELAVAETRRLVQSLSEEKILARRLVVNQLILEQNNTDEGVSTSAYLNRLRQGQKQSLNALSVLAAASDTPLLQVPYFDNEVRTVYGLRAIGNVLLP